MAVSAEIYDERDEWRGPIGMSLGLHALFIATLITWGALHGFWQGSSWGAQGVGGGGGAMRVSMVAQIPLPPSEAPTQNVLATESKGLTQSLPKQVEQVPEAIPIPEKRAPARRTERTATNTEEPRPVPEQPPNVVPFGQGGPANAVNFSMGAGTGGLTIGNGTGDFAARYGWYVEQVRNRISQNWLLYQIDPHVPKGTRVTVSFEIQRNGQPTNVSVLQSSGNPSLDQSALATLKRIDSFGALPNDYRGNAVRVEFYFER
jgi:protein TonB